MERSGHLNFGFTFAITAPGPPITAPGLLFSSKILAGDIPADIIYESDTAIAFRDINPQAPTHVLIIPRKHISTINEITTDDHAVVGSLYSAAQDIAVAEGFADEGYRAVMNCNEAAGQTVFHIHLHLLGGRAFGWPPG